eukprot:2019503-Pleurochrysis_carterae.AAC.5
MLVWNVRARNTLGNRNGRGERKVAFTCKEPKRKRDMQVMSISNQQDNTRNRVWRRGSTL